MKSQLYLGESDFILAENRQQSKVPRPRYIEYQEDLYKIAQGTFDHQSILTGGQYSYTELADKLFNDQDVAAVSQDIDLMVLSYWTPEFDPDYSALGPYLHHSLSLNCKSFDVCDCGSLSSLMALSVIKDYMLSDESIQQTLLIGLEQNSIPLAKAQQFPVPTISSAGFIKITKDSQSGLRILDINLVNEGMVLDKSFDPIAMVDRILTKHAVSSNETVLMVRKDSAFYKQLRFSQLKCSNKLDQLKFDFLPCNYSSMNLFKWVSEALKVTPAMSNVLFIEEDLESLELAYALLTKDDSL